MDMKDFNVTALTKESRDALPDEDFAVPESRDLPMHDERHVRMAWSQIDRTKGLTPAQRTAGKHRIVERAKRLGLDTSGWNVHAVAFHLEAMSLAVPEVKNHPNRMPFSGVLTRIDEPSDQPPGGAGGKRTVIPREVAEQALPSLLGMALDYQDDFSTHNVKQKLGVITEATISGNAIRIAGFLYSKDFPQECARIKAEQARLGFSYECDVFVADHNADPWVFVWCVFTGAAVLYKDKAAYHSTSLAAQAEKDEDMTPEDLRKLQESIAAMSASIATLSTSVAAIGTEVTALKANKGASLTGPIIDAVRPHIESCHACANAMTAAGVGAHPTHGHAALLHAMAAHMAGEASQGRMPHIFNDHSWFDSQLHAGGEGEVDEAKLDAKIKPLADSLKAVTDTLAGINTQLADLKAKSFSAAAAPTRASMSPEVTSLLSKFGIQAGADGTLQKKTIAEVDELLAKAGITGTRERFAAKLNLQAAGVL